jgi:hypothetical protein
MHLLQSGVDIAVIALWLGHESIETTHGYLEADLKLKEKALKKLAPAGHAAPRFQADDPLLAFLKTLSLCRARNDETRAALPLADFTRHNPELGITGITRREKLEQGSFRGAKLQPRQFPIPCG